MDILDCFSDNISTSSFEWFLDSIITSSLECFSANIITSSALTFSLLILFGIFKLEVTSIFLISWGIFFDFPILPPKHVNAVRASLRPNVLEDLNFTGDWSRFLATAVGKLLINFLHFVLEVSLNFEGRLWDRGDDWKILWVLSLGTEGDLVFMQASGFESFNGVIGPLFNCILSLANIVMPSEVT